MIPLVISLLLLIWIIVDTYKHIPKHYPPTEEDLDVYFSWLSSDDD